jgi:hypothetical protein
MSVLILLALCWLGLRTLMLLAQVARHTPEAQLARSFEQEVRERGLGSDGSLREGDR